LIEHGRNVDLLDKKLMTPAHYAAKNGSIEAINVLYQHDANFFVQDSYFKLPRDYAQDNDEIFNFLSGFDYDGLNSSENDENFRANKKREKYHKEKYSFNR
jgi:ankyrin repeat protein